MYQRSFCSNSNRDVCRCPQALSPLTLDSRYQQDRVNVFCKIACLGYRFVAGNMNNLYKLNSRHRSPQLRISSVRKLIDYLYSVRPGAVMMPNYLTDGLFARKQKRSDRRWNGFGNRFDPFVMDGPGPEGIFPTNPIAEAPIPIASPASCSFAMQQILTLGFEELFV